MHQEPRRGTIEVIVLHDNEGPQGANAAANLAGYLQHIDGGYHCIVDNQNTVVVANDNIEVWGNGGINSRSLDICMIGYASGSWADAYSQAEIQRAALWVAGKCKQYGIPARHLTPQEVATSGAKGIARHWDVTLAGFPGSAGHTDPGPNFPIDAFVSRVAALMNPAPPISAELLKWVARVTAKPLQYGQRSGDVLIMNDLLQEKGYLSLSGDRYGLKSWSAVHAFKQAHHWKPGTATGRKFGGAAAQAIIKP